MRPLSAADLHPSILVALKGVTSGTATGANGMAQMNPAYTKWYGVWTKQYWKGLVLWSLGIIPVVAIPLYLKHQVPKPVEGLILLGLMSTWFWAAYAMSKRTTQRTTWEEIEVLRPILDLSENQNIYLDCVKAVSDSRLLEESQKVSWLASLNASLDQAIELEKLYDEIRQSLSGSTVQQLSDEKKRLEDRMRAATDPTSQEIFRQSVELAEDRLRSADGLASQIERAEAHLGLTRLTFIRTKETLTGLDIGTRQASRVDLEPLRANLARVQNDAQAIRAAIDELAQVRLEV